jgi:hypothetical protein
MTSVWEQVAKGWEIKNPKVNLVEINNQIESRLVQMKEMLKDSKDVPSFLDDIYSDEEDDEDW